MEIIENYLRNADKIVELAKAHDTKFKFREADTGHEGLIPNLQSRFFTLYDDDMSDELKLEIFRDSDFPEDVKNYHSFIQIQKYEPGNYIVYHQDTYNIVKLYLIILTTSETDGLCCVDDGILKKIFDKAGNYINFPYDAPHGVEPVKNLRYSLVIGM